MKTLRRLPIRRAASSSSPPPPPAAASPSVCSFRSCSEPARRAVRGDGRRRGQRVGRGEARRHLRHPHRPLRDGAGHAHRTRSARRRRARMRLEQGRRPSFRRRARASRASACGANSAPAAAAASAFRRITCVRGGAVARVMLLQAAADQWKVPVGELTVAEGRDHARRRRVARRRYGKVAPTAAKLTPPDPKSDHAAGSARVENRRQADEAPGHGAQARRQPRVRDRREASGHAERGDQAIARCSAASS